LLIQHRSSEYKYIAQKIEELLLDSCWCCNPRESARIFRF